VSRKWLDLDSLAFPGFDEFVATLCWSKDNDCLVVYGQEILGEISKMPDSVCRQMDKVQQANMQIWTVCCRGFMSGHKAFWPSALWNDHQVTLQRKTQF
jgi:hypothetical protein